jgi:von Willebrand factor type A domain/Putative metal-binding motif
MTTTRMFKKLGALALGGALATGAAAFVIQQARGDGVAQVMTAKSLPASTVAVIDPESGISSGGGSTDVKLAPGDVISFRFNYTPVPDKIVHGLQGYLTEYVPPNTEVVGVRFIDGTGLTIVPDYPGIAVNDCGRTCNGFNSMPSSTGTRNLDDGSISQLYADTGVFFSTDARTQRNPGNAFITFANGVLMNPFPTNIGSVSGILGTASPFFAHNAWDYTQVKAFGVSGAVSGNNGTGNTPFKYGSPVAGPQTFYGFEATEFATSPTIRFNDTVGPWQRIKYPGSQIGSGTAITTNGSLKRMNVDTSLGFDLKPLTPLPSNTKALRYAGGEVRVGEARFAEVTLRVLQTPIDPIQNKDSDCAETFGGDTSAASDTVRAKDNPWGVYLGSPACVFLNLLFDLNVDKTLAVVGDTLTYTLHGKNLSVNPQTNAVPRLRYDSTRVAFVSATGGPTNLATCDDGSGLSCLRWPAMTLAPSDEYTFSAAFTVGGGGHVTNVATANYRSDQLPAPGFNTQSISMVKEVAVVRASLTAPQTATTAGTNVALSGTISNAGSGPGSYDQLVIVLPTGWTVPGSHAITIAGASVACSSLCTTNTPTYTLNQSFTGGQVKTLNFTAAVPGGTVTGLYPVDLQIWASQQAFGGAFETYFPRAALVAVGQGRSDIPTVTCPINMGDTTISGTSSEIGATIHVYFNLQERCSPTVAANGTWSCTTFTSSFGSLYGGLEVRASADGTSELEGALSAPCYVSSVPACADFVDNDGDGLTDFPADPGCTSRSDNTETDTPVQCSDGVDNDGDGLIDMADTGCQAPFDTTESGPPACNDGIDNDGDGLSDLGDPGCTSMFDASEFDVSACMDFEDNDGDGLKDFPADPGCHSPNDDSEATEGVVPGDIQARLLIVFDTSGSMNFNTCASTFTGGDGSQECPGGDVSCAACNAAGCGNGIADDSRLFKVKAGISDVVAAFGEVEYGLMRFHERNMSFACPSAQASLQSGGWQGAGAAPCGGGFNAGDLIVSFSPENQYDLIEWLDEKDNYPGTPPPGFDVELRGSGTTPLGGSLSSARTVLQSVRAADSVATCRPYRVILVTDGEETCGGDPAGQAAALLSAGIPVYVIGFATPDPTIIANLNGIAAAGGTGSAIFVNDSATLSTAMASIVTETVLVETCNGADDDCDGLVDEDFPGVGGACDNGKLGACRRTGTIVCTSDQLGAECNAPAGGTGTPEVCNGIDDDCNGVIDDGIVCTPCQSGETCNGADDDCDGQIDEAPITGVGTTCGINVGRCRTGTIQCVSGGLTCVGSTGPIPEICNNIDDDCDTVVDGFAQECYTGTSGCTLGNPSTCQGVCRTGLSVCTAGSFGTCNGQVTPSAEKCNGLDDDCDGLTDEDFPTLGQACSNGQVGACAATGVIACKADGSGAFCTAPVVGTGTEICNGMDDDCDGQIDEGLGAPIGNSCGGGAGCTAGTLACVGGNVVCTGTSGGTPEVCNGFDDDCDGLIDEPDLPDTGGNCDDSTPTTPGHGDVGECEFGHLTCQNGALVCPDYHGPGPEACNGKDDDCDGVADNQATCPGGEDICHEGTCLSPCGAGEFPCGFGYTCQTLPEGRFCVPDPCEAVQCNAGFECDHDTGQCIDRCEGITCLDGQSCRNGFCIDCGQIGCGEGERCVHTSTGINMCETDPCYMNNCDPATQFCQDGQCLDLQCDPPCTDGMQCVQGQCVNDLCTNVTCGAGQVCNPATGTCISDPCAGVDCAPGMVCNPGTGMCIGDPCADFHCGTGQECHVGFDGLPQCAETNGIDVLATGGGGCGCSVGAREGGMPRGLVWLLAGGLVIALRRRRASSRTPRP